MFKLSFFPRPPLTEPETKRPPLPTNRITLMGIIVAKDKKLSKCLDLDLSFQLEFI